MRRWSGYHTLGIAHCVALAIGFCGGLWAFDGPKKVAKQKFLLPVCNERPQGTEPNCIVGDTSDSMGSPDGRAPSDVGKVASATESKEPFGR